MRRRIDRNMKSGDAGLFLSFISSARSKAMKNVFVLVISIATIGCNHSVSDGHNRQPNEAAELQMSRERQQEVTRLQELLQGNPLEVHGSALLIGVPGPVQDEQMEITKARLACWLGALHFREDLFSEVRIAIPEYADRTMRVIATLQTPLEQRLTPPDCTAKK